MNATTSDPRTVVTDMWRTRPTRRETDRKIAGVAAALVIRALRAGHKPHQD